MLHNTVQELTRAYCCLLYKLGFLSKSNKCLPVKSVKYSSFAREVEETVEQMNKT